MLRLTITMLVASCSLTARAGEPPAELPTGVTSLGGIATGDTLYIYGGHTGEAHTYSTEMQSNAFSALSLEDPAEWHSLPTGPKLQGLALAAFGDKVYRLGGFSALNSDEEDAELVSQADVAVFDPQVGHWKECTPLPEPRSSFDTAVLGNHLYVIGGWALKGSANESEFHKTAWRADLTQEPLQWNLIAEPPFTRRAVAVEAFNGEIYVIGGMTGEDATRRVDIFDPETDEWRQGPDLFGEEDLDGFGTAALGNDSGLYVSSLARVVQRLSDDGKSWESIAKLESPRFFHQMIEHDNTLWLVGGANMVEGKLLNIEVVNLAKASATNPASEDATQIATEKPVATK